MSTDVKYVVLAVVASLALAAAGCKRTKPPVATRVWLGPSGGCIATAGHPSLGTLGCWSVNDAGQLGDGTTTARSVASPMRFSEGEPSELALGPRHSCGVFDRRVYCWGDGSRGQLGIGPQAARSSTTPIAAADEGADVGVAVGGAHSCALSVNRRHLRCFGADDEGQLGKGGPATPVSDWDRGAEIRFVALGAAHTCVAFAKSESNPESVVCRGRKVAASREPLLEVTALRSLVAGAEHTCALLEDRTVRCWGRNDAGQLGDGTTNDALTPVSVLDLRDVDAIAAGARHTCAKLMNNTVVCWGDNTRHQLASGTTERSSRPTTVTGIVGVQAIVAAGDGSCARMGDGAVRCWGRNDRGQLGDGSKVEHTVPMPIRFH